MVVNSDDLEDDDFDVEVCEEDGTANEFPSTAAGDCTALTAPASFVGIGNVVFTHTGLALSANTNYVVVIKQRGTGSVELDSTTSSGEDASGLSDWSIKNKFYWKSGSTWMEKSGSNEALSIIVFGYANTVVTTDATLSALSVSGATLSPAFDAATTTYSATVANAVTQVTITETTSEPTATVEYLDNSDATRTDADTMTADLQVNLSVGSNIVKVKVTAPDTTTTETYTVNVFRFAVPGTGTQVWSATLTAGEVQVGGTVLTIGFNQYTALGASSYGSLSDDDFDLLGTTYTIETLTIASRSQQQSADKIQLRPRRSGPVPHPPTRLRLLPPRPRHTLVRQRDFHLEQPRTLLVQQRHDLGVADVDVHPAPPAVSSVALTSAPGSDNTYAIGDAVEATVTFDAAVDITGTPQLELDFAGTAKAAGCATGTNTTTMACSYTVLVGDSAPNGVAIAANKLTGGTITATGSTTITADLTHTAVA